MRDRWRRQFTRCVALAALAVCAVTGCGPSDPLERIRGLQDRGGFEATLEPLRELLVTRPDDPEVLYLYGLALAATEQNALAIWPLEKALASPEWRVKAGLLLASALVKTRSYDDAIEACGRVLADEPDHIPALTLRSHVRVLSRRNYDAALADADRVLELDPDDEGVLAPRAVALLALGRVEEAGAAIEALEERFRDDSLGLHGSAGYCAARASFAKEKGELDLATERYDTCLEQFPADGLLVQDALDFYDGSGRPDRSKEVLERAIAAVPQAHNYRKALVLRLLEEGSRSDAEALLRAATELESPLDAAEAWASLGSFLSEAGDHEEAALAFARAREIDPSASPQLLFAHADALVVAGRYDEALELASGMAVEAHRAMVQGRVALLRGDASAALEHFSQGMRLWPDNAVARYYAAVAAEWIGDFDRAIEEYRYAMRIDPLATDAHLRLARLYAAAGDDEKAVTSLAVRAGPSELEADLLHLHLLARLGRADGAPKALLQRLGPPQRRGAAVAALARGVRERRGAAAAAEVVRARRLDLTDPLNADALEALVEALAESGEGAQALAEVDAGLRLHPDAAPLHALRGRALELGGAPGEGARAAFARALEIDGDDTRALVGLARLEAERGAREPALALYERALRVDPHDRATAREAATLLALLQRREAAEERLEALLREHPYDAEAALALARLRAERGAADERTVELARRAVHFRGGPAAEAFLERLDARPSPEESRGGGTS
jgi:tetratricopeptide (TPR) repeat protein